MIDPAKPKPMIVTYGAYDTDPADRQWAIRTDQVGGSTNNGPRLSAEHKHLRLPVIGWQALSKLQLEVNQGAVGLIVARRTIDGQSGHIVAVVPETEENRARRNAAGEVIAPLQSQAGVTNFRYGTGKMDWWRSAEFAEFAYWLHP